MNALENINHELSNSLAVERNTRFSKFLANNISDFSIFSNESIAIDLAAYLLEHCQKNIPDAFGFYVFQYDAYCELFKYAPENLFRHFQLADSIAFLQGQEIELSKIPYIVRRERESVNLDEIFDKTQKGDKAFSTCILGNMFYELRYKNFVPQDRKAIFKDKQGSIVELHGADFNLIEQYHVVYSRNRRDKTIIYFKPNSNLLFNNFKYFLFTDLNKFKELGTNKKKLFIYLCSKINELKLHSQNEFKLTVNEGCRISNINLSEAKQNKKKLKMFLTEINGLLDTSDRFELKEEKLTAESKYRYLLSLEFRNLKSFDKKEIDLINKVRYQDYYRKALYDNYIKYYFTLDNGLTEKINFEDWISDDNVDMEHKMTAYIESQAVVYGKKLGRSDYEVLKEFTPSISLTQGEAKEKLLSDPRLLKVSSLYGLKINYPNLKMLTDNQIIADKFLNHSIDMFLKAYPGFKEVVYAEDKDQFCIILKENKAEKILTK